MGKKELRDAALGALGIGAALLPKALGLYATEVPWWPNIAAIVAACAAGGVIGSRYRRRRSAAAKRWAYAALGGYLLALVVGARFGFALHVIVATLLIGCTAAGCYWAARLVKRLRRRRERRQQCEPSLWTSAPGRMTLEETAVWLEEQAELAGDDDVAAAFAELAELAALRADN